MCRFICYLGPDLLVADLLYKPTNSLVLQSYRAKERTEPLNGDGFGIGWYAPDVGPVPATFVCLTPAWSNQNLRSLAEHVRAPCFFGHIRAASPGMRVTETNCHPFQVGRYLWMHNGVVGGFSKIRRRLRGSLPDRLCDLIQGTTDSEHAFMLFLSMLGDHEPSEVAELAGAMTETIVRLEHLRLEAGIDEPSFCNFAVTDGRNLVATRYVSDTRREAISLYVSSGRRYVADGERTRLVCACASECSAIVASEPLTDTPGDWIRIAPNHIVAAGADRAVTVEPIRA
jgi:predicted glutamine amidotransferase